MNPLRIKEKTQTMKRFASHLNALAVLFIAFGGHTPHADGTSVVILASSTQIVVAADSKVANSQEHRICKIYKLGSMYWSMSGLVSKHLAGYDVAELVRKSYASGRSVADTLHSFEKNAPSPLERALESFRSSPREFERIRLHPLEIAFWSIEDGKPVVGHVFYTADLSGQKVSVRAAEETIIDCRKDDCTATTRATFLGVRGFVLTYLPQHPEWTSDLIRTARVLVDLSVHEAPDVVGYPINEFTVSLDNSYHWISSTECCHHGRLLPEPEP